MQFEVSGKTINPALSNRLIHHDHFSGALCRMQVKRRCCRQTDRQTTSSSLNVPFSTVCGGGWIICRRKISENPREGNIFWLIVYIKQLLKTRCVVCDVDGHVTRVTCINWCVTCTGRDAGRATSRWIPARQTQTVVVSLYSGKPLRLHRGPRCRLAMQAERQLPGQTRILTYTVIRNRWAF